MALMALSRIAGCGRFAIAAVAGFVLPLAAGCGSKAPPPKPPPPTVTAAVATQGTIYPSEQLAGIIAPYQNVAIQSTLAEPADEVPVSEGDFVHIVDFNDRSAGVSTQRGMDDRLTWRFKATDVRDFDWGTSARFLWDATVATISA